jgi:hypothetical protein
MNTNERIVEYSSGTRRNSKRIIKHKFGKRGKTLRYRLERPTGAKGAASLRQRGGPLSTRQY